MLKKKLILFMIPVSALCLAQTSHARLNTLTGGLTTGYDFDETKYENSTVEGIPPTENSYFKQFNIAPLLILETTSSRDNLTIRFNPSFTYDQETSQNDIDHNFSIAAYRDFTRRLRLELSNGFIYSNDPELLEQEISSDYNRGRRRYWTNNFHFNSNYTYATGSSVGAGYIYRILRNDDTGPGGYEDYDRHIADLSLQHQFNAAWNIALTTSYTRGLFDPPESEVVGSTGEELEGIPLETADNIDEEDLSSDLSEYRTSTTVNWLFSPRKTFFISHTFMGSDYDDTLRNNSELHDLTLGTRYQHTRQLSFELGGGPSYEKTETFDGTWNYNAHFNLDYNIAENSSLAASVTKGYEQQNFSQNNSLLGGDQGLTEFWQWNLNFSHELVTDLTATLFATYRDERQESSLQGITSSIESDTNLETLDNETFREESTFDRKIYQAGGSLSYAFLRWYTASVRYTYRQQDSEQINDSYDEHRVYLTLSVQKELLRW